MKTIIKLIAFIVLALMFFDFLPMGSIIKIGLFLFIGSKIFGFLFGKKKKPKKGSIEDIYGL